MDRRTALKNITAGLGYTVATPTILSILSSCSKKTETWTPLFLSEDEKHVVTHLVDIILPKTEIPGALDVNIPQFIDLMFHDVEPEFNKEQFKKGSEFFSKKTIQNLDKPISDLKKEEFNVVLDSYLDLSEENSKKVLKQQKLNIKNLPKDEAETYLIYKFLLTVRYYAIFGYCTSEEIGEHVLAYDPVPGVYLGCISLEETTHGRAWSL